MNAKEVMYMVGGGLGNHHPMRDLTHNVGICTKLMAHEYEKNKRPVSDRERKLGYVAIFFLTMVIVCIISLFIFL